MGIAASSPRARAKAYAVTVDVAHDADEVLDVLSRFMDSTSAHATVEKTSTVTLVRISSTAPRDDD